MNEYGSPEDQQPVMWVRGYPVYAAYFIVAIFVASMLATAILMGLSVAQPWAWLPFSSAHVLRGQVWRVVTYGLLNPPSLTFVIDMAMFVWFGREVEKFLGRRKFMFLFGCVYLLTPLLFTLIARVAWPTQFAGKPGHLRSSSRSRPSIRTSRCFSASWRSGWRRSWSASITLMALSSHDWQGVITLWATTAFAFAFMRFQQGLITLPSFSLFQRKPRLRVLIGHAGGGALPGPEKAGSMAEVDALLDKIAQSGFSSLTAQEKARLDSARDELSKRGSRR